MTSRIKSLVIPAKAGIQKMKTYFVYILASKKNGTIYIGVTSNLARRISQHKQSEANSFTKKYKVYNLVWAERCDSINSAIQREKNMKAWKRAWKIELIEKSNPQWRDLSYEVI